MVAAEEEKKLRRNLARITGRGVRNSGGDRLFYVLDAVLLTTIFLLVLYPIIFILSASFSDAHELVMGRVWLWPVQPSLEGYKAVFKYNDVWIGYGNTIFYTFFGTILNVVMTLIVVYPLSRRDFVGRNIIMFLFTFTMFFSGGLIPTYLLIKSLGLVDTRAVMIVPWAIGVWNVIITRTYLQANIPVELYDSARVDGASNSRMLLMIVIPLSGPIIAVITLFYAVNHWNQFFNALIYLRRKALRPLQLVLRAHAKIKSHFPRRDCIIPIWKISMPLKLNLCQLSIRNFVSFFVFLAYEIGFHFQTSCSFRCPNKLKHRFESL